jgi:membrane-bound acyltransferase YfiQ involved in biofilm formation
MTRRLLLLNGLAVLMIPLHHSTFLGLEAMFVWTDRYMNVSVPNFDQLGSLSYYVLMFIRQMDAFGVPAFLFVSGFYIAFMARGESRQVTQNDFLPRIKVLLVPFILWTMIRYVLLTRVPASIDDILDPYYYLVVLIQLYLLSPWLVRIADSRPGLLLAAAALIHLSFRSIMFFNLMGVDSPVLDLVTKYNVRWVFPAWLLHFSLGLVAGLNVESASAWLHRMRWWLLAAVIATLSLSLVEYELLARWSGQEWLGPNNPGITRMAYATLVAPCFLGFAATRLPLSRHLAYLGANSLGIYLGNLPFAYLAAVIMYHFTPAVLGAQPVYQAVLILAGFGGPLILMWLWKRLPVRRYYRLAFG